MEVAKLRRSDMLVEILVGRPTYRLSEALLRIFILFFYQYITPLGFEKLLTL
jgi:hypothetical protein